MTVSRNGRKRGKVVRMTVNRRRSLTLVTSSDTSSESSSLGQRTRQALAALTPREEMVLRCGFGIGVEPRNNLNEVGKKFSMTPAQVKHIQAKAFQKLRQNVRAPWPKGSGSL